MHKTPPAEHTGVPAATSIVLFALVAILLLVFL